MTFEVRAPYHSTLKKMFTTNIVPANVSIETKEVDEEVFNDVFITNNVDDEACFENSVENENENLSDASFVFTILSEDGEPEEMEIPGSRSLNKTPTSTNSASRSFNTTPASIQSTPRSTSSAS
jgi:hypothetical protein